MLQTGDYFISGIMSTVRKKMLFMLKEAVAVLNAMDDGDVSELSDPSDTDENESKHPVTTDEGGVTKVAKCRSKPVFKPFAKCGAKPQADVEPDNETEECQVEDTDDTSSELNLMQPSP